MIFNKEFCNLIFKKLEPKLVEYGFTTITNDFKTDDIMELSYMYFVLHTVKYELELSVIANMSVIIRLKEKSEQYGYHDLCYQNNINHQIYIVDKPFSNNGGLTIEIEQFNNTEEYYINFLFVWIKTYCEFHIKKLELDALLEKSQNELQTLFDNIPSQIREDKLKELIK